MKNKLILLFVILLGLVVFFVILQFANQTKINNQIQEKNNSSVSYQLLTDEKGEVVVEALPTKLSTKENSAFTIKFTTHSVDLNYDFKNISILTDDKGNQYNALFWTGGKGGHHIEGTLTFPKISAEADSVRLEIPGIDNNDRIFEWELN